MANLPSAMWPRSTDLVAANLYVVAFGISWGPVMWVLLGEMFPNRMRAEALAVSGATIWLANFGVTVSFLPLLTAVGLAGAYGLYCPGCHRLAAFRLESSARNKKAKPLRKCRKQKSNEHRQNTMTTGTLQRNRAFPPSEFSRNERGQQT
jgi:hypothetical protein